MLRGDTCTKVEKKNGMDTEHDSDVYECDRWKSKMNLTEIWRGLVKSPKSEIVVQIAEVCTTRSLTK